LFGKQRVPLRHLDDPANDIRPDGSGSVDDKALDVGGRERLELHYVGGFPVRPLLEEVGTGQAQQENRLSRLPREVVHELEEVWLGPMNVLEQHDKGPTGGKGLEETTDRREQDRHALRFGSQSDRRSDLGRDVLSVVVVHQQPMQPAPFRGTRPPRSPRLAPGGRPRPHQVPDNVG
jgi:hypothetical protein